MTTRVSNEKLDLTATVGSDDREIADYPGILLFLSFVPFAYIPISLCFDTKRL